MSNSGYYKSGDGDSSGNGGKSHGGGGRHGGSYSGGKKYSYSNEGSSYRPDEPSSGGGANHGRYGRDYYSGYGRSAADRSNTAGSSNHGRYDLYTGSSDRRSGVAFEGRGKSSYVPSSYARDRDRNRERDREDRGDRGDRGERGDRDAYRRYDRYDSYTGSSSSLYRARSKSSSGSPSDYRRSPAGDERRGYGNPGPSKSPAEIRPRQDLQPPTRADAHSSELLVNANTEVPCSKLPEKRDGLQDNAAEPGNPEAEPPSMKSSPSTALLKAEGASDVPTDEPPAEQKFESEDIVADSSVLSSVGDSVGVDDAYFKQLNTIAETGIDAENVSDAETVHTMSPPRLNKARRLVRKLEFDQDRHELKRSRLLIDDDSDDEADDKELGKEDHKPSDNRPYKLKRDSTGRSLLQRACGKGSLAEVKCYIEKGADPNESDHCGFTCLHEAALEGHSDVVEFLIKSGADVNKQAQKAGDLETPLIDAAENKHLETVKTLLNNGADVRVYNLDGFTALTKIQNEHTGEPGYDEIIKVLEEANNRYVAVDGANFEKAEPAAILKDHMHGFATSARVVEDPNDYYFSELIKRKNHANFIYRFAAEGLKELTANYFVEGGRLTQKPDILILAARNGHLELVDIILGLNPGAYDIDQENACGLTALVASVGRGHVEVVKFLLSKGADPRRKRKQDGLNCLEIAQSASLYDTEEIEVLQAAISKHSAKEKPLSCHTEELVEPRKRKLSADSLELNSKQIKSGEYEKVSDLEAKAYRALRHNSPVVPKQTSPELSKSLAKFSDVSRAPRPDDNKRINFSASPSPVPQSPPHANLQLLPLQAPLTKEQDELRAKNAEEAKQWQEKVEAKKRARRDMFLKAEKEKERRRKEEEAKRAQEEVKSRIAKEKELQMKAAEEAQRVQQLTKERQSLEHRMIIENYPIGLRAATFGRELEHKELVHYLPLYTFEIEDQVCVLDLQIALCTGCTVGELLEGVATSLLRAVTSSQKSRLWRLFFPLIGTDPTTPFDNVYNASHEGYRKFVNLQITFVPFEMVAKIVGTKFPTCFATIEKRENQAVVDLNTLLAFDTAENSDATVPSCGGDDARIAVDSDALLQNRFVPPNLKRRTDAMKLLQTISIPLW